MSRGHVHNRTAFGKAFRLCAALAVVAAAFATSGQRNGGEAGGVEAPDGERHPGGRSEADR